MGRVVGVELGGVVLRVRRWSEELGGRLRRGEMRWGWWLWLLGLGLRLLRLHGVVG